HSLSSLHLLPPPPPTPTLFPYTTLFRSPASAPSGSVLRRRSRTPARTPRTTARRPTSAAAPSSSPPTAGSRSRRPGSSDPAEVRSEEHTSELQSRGHLVCRLLLEKKNKK